MVEMTDMERGLQKLPERMRGGLLRYLIQGIPPGDFLRCVISNDLLGAFERADDDNALLIRDYLVFLYNYAPSQAWGSVDRYHKWLAQGGWSGLEASDAA